MQRRRSVVVLWGVVGLGATLPSACGGGGGNPPGGERACDDQLKAIDIGSGVTIPLVKAFKSGDTLALESPAPGDAPIASADLCFVKILVGPGNPGPVGAPSTSAGIGIEVWLPTHAHWNQRYQAQGGGGWQGGPAFTSLTAIGQIGAALPAMGGFVTSATDTGHGVGDEFLGTGAFAINPDGSFNQALFVDYAERAAHEMALKTKALIQAYYGEAPAYSYWNGCSKGGQQGLMEAQRHPDDFDGVLAAAPAVHFDRFSVAELWPQIVMLQDLGGPLAFDKLEATKAAAIAACSPTLTGVADGYVTDPAACRYDPAADPTLLCVAAGGNNAGASCLTLAEASAIDKMWYGPTTDGTAPSPAADSGWNPGAALGNNQLWYGLPRGTSWRGLGTANPLSISTDAVALSLLDPTYATPAFVNATGNGADRWKTIGYTGDVSFAAVFAQSRQRLGDLIATDNPDLSALNARGGKLLMWHGTADGLIFAQGTVSYYERVAAATGGYAAAQAFARFYLAPGIDHCGTAAVPGSTPTAPGGRVDDPNAEIIGLLQRWVENGEAPDQLAATSAPGVTPVRNRPWCLYPKKLKYVSGDVNTGTFTCE